MLDDKKIDETIANLNSSPNGIDEKAAEGIRLFHEAKTFADREKIAAILVSDLAFLIFQVGRRIESTVPFYRVRAVSSNSVCFDKGTAFDAAPAAVTKRGRANDDNLPVWYASLTADTAMEEIRSKSGAMKACNIAQFFVNDKETFRLSLVGEIDHFRRFGTSFLPHPDADIWINRIQAGLRDDVLRAAQLADAFFADEFQKPDSGDRSQYVVTTLIAKELMQNSGVDGIVYPSVAYRGGLNVAAKLASAKKLSAVSYTAYDVRRYLGYGMFGVIPYAEAESLQTNGQIAWRFSPHGNARYCIPDDGF